MRTEQFIRHGLDVRHAVVDRAEDVVPTFLERLKRPKPLAEKEVLTRA